MTMNKGMYSGMKTREAELVVDCHCLLGEGPVWDERSESLLWIDIKKSNLHRYDPKSGEHYSIATENAVASFALRENGEGAIAAGVGGIYWLDTETGAMASISDPEVSIAGSRFNDGKCDSKGRFLAGTIVPDGKRDGAFYTIDSALHVHRNFGDVNCSNGIAWSLDERILYYIDSPTLAVVAYEYDSETGRIGAGETVITLPAGGSVPDGMTADSEGMLWIAEWGNERVGRWNPLTGELLETVSVPSKFVTSCVFAGEGSNILYITTAGDDDSEHAHAGGLFRVVTDTTGRAMHYFKD